jgi:hypothetical protein
MILLKILKKEEKERKKDTRNKGRGNRRVLDGLIKIEIDNSRTVSR